MSATNMVTNYKKVKRKRKKLKTIQQETAQAEMAFFPTAQTLRTL